jgi:beta-glucosidase
MQNRILKFTLLLSSLSLGCLLAQTSPDLSSDPAEILANQLLAKLTVEQKISLCHGDGTMTINAIPEIGLNDEFCMSDGPNAVRRDVNKFDFASPPGRDPKRDESTALPRLVALAATFNRNLGKKFGEVIGEEARDRGKDMMLGPGVNMVRTPLCGRDMEYLGEDPYLSGQMAVQDILGIQSKDVAACVKHFALNNQEMNRGKVDVEVDDRTLHEIYLPAFEAAVRDGHVLTVMGAYNKVRGKWCCESDLLLNQILKKSWSFPGFVVSDWGATHGTASFALGGLDVEMDSGNKIHFFNQPLLAAVQSGQVPMSVLDDKARRVLYVMAKIHKLDGQPRAAGSRNTPEHQAIAQQIAEESIVLLKNDRNILPLDPAKTRTVLMIGENATATTSYGGGSSQGKPPFEVTPEQGMARLLGPNSEIKTAAYGGKIDPSALAAMAKTCDAVFFFTGDKMGRGPNREAEGGDRPNLDQPPGTTEALTAVLTARPDTVVINESGAPVAMPWVDRAPTLVQYWFSGMEGGTALARVLFGQVNPSGKMPVSFPRQLQDSPAHALGNYNPDQVNYAEGVLMGYRWFDAKNIEPLFPFGFGLSYTTFRLDHLQLDKAAIKIGDSLHVTATVSNAGKVAGAQVVQLYVGDASASVARPPHELKGFEKVMLQPGETKTVTFTLDPRAFSYWDVKTDHWKIDPGQFSIFVGDSSRNLPLQAPLQMD